MVKGTSRVRQLGFVDIPSVAWVYSFFVGFPREPRCQRLAGIARIEREIVQHWVELRVDLILVCIFRIGDDPRRRQRTLADG